MRVGRGPSGDESAHTFRGRFVQNLSSAVLVALGGALVVFGGYHALVVGPALRRLNKALDAHDALLSNGSGKASGRVAALESASGDLARRSDELERRLAVLEASLVEKIPHIGFVRYNAFDNTGSDLSYALALLTKTGDGVVISSIWSREETRTYGKAVTAFNSAQDASNEERAAIAKARAAAS
jgi:hypothetical protein